MKVSKKVFVETMLRYVEHREQRLKWADTLDEPMRSAERQEANETIKRRFEEVFDAMPSLNTTSATEKK